MHSCPNIRWDVLRCERKALLSAVSPLVSARSTLAPGNKCESLQIASKIATEQSDYSDYYSDYSDYSPVVRGVDFLLIKSVSPSPNIKTMAQTFMLDSINQISIVQAIIIKQAKYSHIICCLDSSVSLRIAVNLRTSRSGLWHKTNLESPT